MKKERPLLGLETSLKPFRIVDVKRSTLKHDFTCSMFACRELSDLSYATTIMHDGNKGFAHLCSDCFFEWLDHGIDNTDAKADAFREGWEVACDCCEETIEDEAIVAGRTSLRIHLQHDGSKDECYSRITQAMCVCATCYEEVKNH